MEKIKEKDVKGVNKPGIINMDQFLEILLRKYRELLNKTKNIAITAFNAAGLYFFN